MNKNVAVIGGGASGLMCAIILRQNQNDVTIFETNEKVGKKILQTGNGRCNFCNQNLDENKFNNKQFVKQIFSRVGKDEILKIFSDIGLEYYFDEEGRCYPMSNQASSVLDVLRFECDRLGVKFVCEKKVNEIKKLNSGFEILGNVFDKVVVACGNLDKTILERFGHKFVPQREGLCSLFVDKNDIVGMSGIRVKAKVSADILDEHYQEYGEIQFKNNSLGGICIFNISSLISRKNIKKSIIFADFAPNYDKLLLINKIKNKINYLINEQIENIFVGFFNRFLSNLFLKKANVDPKKVCGQISEEEIERLADIIKKYPLHVQGTDGVGQVKIGGWDVNQFDYNLQSKLVKDLFAIGECLDIDGLCGGYNLSWAWASAIVVGRN